MLVTLLYRTDLGDRERGPRLGILLPINASAVAVALPTRLIAAAARECSGSNFPGFSNDGRALCNGMHRALLRAAIESLLTPQRKWRGTNLPDETPAYEPGEVHTSLASLVR